MSLFGTSARTTRDTAPFFFPKPLSAVQPIRPRHPQSVDLRPWFPFGNRRGRPLGLSQGKIGSSGSGGLGKEGRNKPDEGRKKERRKEESRERSFRVPVLASLGLGRNLTFLPSYLSPLQTPFTREKWTPQPGLFSLSSRNTLLQTPAPLSPHRVTATHWHTTHKGITTPCAKLTSITVCQCHRSIHHGGRWMVTPLMEKRSGTWAPPADLLHTPAAAPLPGSPLPSVSASAPVRVSQHRSLPRRLHPCLLGSSSLSFVHFFLHTSIPFLLQLLALR